MKYLFAASAAFAILATACGGGSSDPTPAPAIATAPGTLAPTATPTAVPPTSPPSPTTAEASPTAATSPTAGAATPSTPVPTPAPASTPPPASSAQTITITAHDISFDKSEVHVRVGTKVTAVFQNTDVGTDHNLTFNLPGLEHPTCTGPCTTTQNFTASTAGKFAFFCTIHAEMFGDFFIDP